jgi:hypothetical protein
MLSCREQNMLKDRDIYYTHCEMTLLKLELFNRLNQPVLVTLISFRDAILLLPTAKNMKFLLLVIISLISVTVPTEKASPSVDEILIEDL